jgi:hypothetical protein
MRDTIIILPAARPAGQRKQFHLLMMIITCGAWTPVWVIDVLVSGG